jgi:mannose/fructose-specific phosphotransferase system component IIA
MTKYEALRKALTELNHDDLVCYAYGMCMVLSGICGPEKASGIVCIVEGQDDDDADNFNQVSHQVKRRTRQLEVEGN